MMSKWLFWVGIEWAVICATLWIVSWSTWAVVPAVLLLGSRQHALGILGHDAVHHATGFSRKLNDSLGNLLCMWPILSDVKGYRDWHLLHHAFLGGEKDPERLLKAKFPDMYDELPSPSRRLRLLIDDCLGLHLNEAFAFLAAVFGPMSYVRSTYYFGFVILLCLTFGPLAALCWFVSMFTTFWVCMHWRVWHEHMGPEETLEYRPAFWQRLLFVPHGMWKHKEHHKNGQWSIAGRNLP